MSKVLLVVLKDSASLALVVAPGGEQLGGELVIGVADYFPNEGKLTLR